MGSRPAASGGHRLLAHALVPASFPAGRKLGLPLTRVFPLVQGRSGSPPALELLFQKPPSFWRVFCKSTEESGTLPKQRLPGVSRQVSQRQPPPSPQPRLPGSS